MQINKKIVILSVSFLYGICVNLIYRPFVYQNHLNDFGIADIGNNLTFIPVIYFTSYFLKKGYSYSKYLEYEGVQEYMKEHIAKNWIDNVLKAKNFILRGKEAYEQINILGDDSVPIQYHDRYWKSEVIDFAFLQQDAFDKIDCYSPIERQKYMMEFILDICNAQFDFKGFEEVQHFFKNVINLLKQMKK